MGGRHHATITPSLWFDDDLDEARATAATVAVHGMRKIVITELEDAVGS